MTDLPRRLCQCSATNNPVFFRMKTKHVTHSSLHIPKGTVRDPPKGTHKEFASTMKSSTSKVSKGKAIKRSIPGIGRPTSPEHRVSKIPKTSTSTAYNGTEGHNALTNSPLHVPIVPVL